jgi:C_GCAxxG_C_C family probable redox protein
MAVERGAELFHLGWNCAESVFMAIYEQAGDGEVPVYLVTPLGGGMGCKRTCGALSGATVSLGLAYGRTSPDEGAKKLAMAKSRELCHAFRERHHSIDCWELTSACENDEAGKCECAELVRTAVELACELMGGTTGQLKVASVSQSS